MKMFCVVGGELMELAHTPKEWRATKIPPTSSPVPGDLIFLGSDEKNAPAFTVPLPGQQGTVGAPARMLEGIPGVRDAQELSYPNPAHCGGIEYVGVAYATSFLYE